MYNIIVGHEPFLCVAENLCHCLCREAVHRAARVNLVDGSAQGDESPVRDFVGVAIFWTQDGFELFQSVVMRFDFMHTAKVRYRVMHSGSTVFQCL